MSQARLLRERRFYPLFWTQFLGAFNDNFLKNALVILITYRSAVVLGIPSSQMVAAAGGIFILPFFLFSATAGQLADKLEKTRIIRLIKLIEIGIMALATVGFVTKQFGFLLVVLFLMGLHSTFFGPIKYSILPQHLRENELVGGNALIETGTNLAILIGTLLGGMINDVGAAIASTGLLVAAVAGFFASLRIPKADAVAPDLTVEWNPIRPTLRVLRETKSNRAVFLSILGISWFWFYGAAMLSLFPPYCKDLLRTNEHVVSLFLAIFCVGIGAGSLLCEKLSRKRLELGVVPFGSIGLSVFTVDLFLRKPPLLPQGSGPAAFLASLGGLHITLDLVLISVFSGLFIVPLYTLVQERSDPRVRSRVIAANNIINAIFMVTAAVLLVALERLGYGPREIFLILGVLNALVAAYIYTLLPEFLMRFCVWILGVVMYRIRVTGEDNVPYGKATVFVCNHVTFIDWMIISAVIKEPICFVMDHNFFKGRLLRLLLTQGGVIPIAPSKENPDILKTAFVKVAQALRDGRMVCIFPEGSLTHDGQMRPFLTGVERILAETPVPVVPLALSGMWGSFFSRHGGRAFAKRPQRFRSRVRLMIGKPLDPSGTSAKDLGVRVQALLDQATQELR